MKFVHGNIKNVEETNFVHVKIKTEARTRLV